MMSAMGGNVNANPKSAANVRSRANWFSTFAVPAGPVVGGSALQASGGNASAATCRRWPLIRLVVALTRYDNASEGM